MIVKPCQPYYGKVERRCLLRMPGRISVFKTYFISITGRDDPARYEWSAARSGIAAVGESLCNSGVEGVGFITAFPHITKFFRFAPAVETVLHVRAFHTEGLRPLPLEREDAFSEFACLGEALIAADEYRAWARAASVAAYLEEWSDWQSEGICDPGKLGAYAGGRA